jgi:hypothetical protein
MCNMLNMSGNQLIAARYLPIMTGELNAIFERKLTVGVS